MDLQKDSTVTLRAINKTLTAADDAGQGATLTLTYLIGAAD